MSRHLRIAGVACTLIAVCAAAAGATEASASVGPGSHPYEPFLVTFLLPVAGIVALLTGFYMDKKIRAQGGGSKRS